MLSCFQERLDLRQELTKKYEVFYQGDALARFAYGMGQG